MSYNEKVHGVQGFSASSTTNDKLFIYFTEKDEITPAADHCFI